MSCYQCDAHHIAVLAACLTKPWPNGLAIVDMPYEQVFTSMWQANAISVAARYPADGGPVPAPPAPRLPGEPRSWLGTVPNFAVRLIKSTRCFVYQSEDSADWESHIARRWCDQLVVVAEEHLRGYSDAPWGAAVEPTRP